MLAELAVTDLGVIAHSRLVLGPGLTALTGETGAGKTMVVEAIGLLLGGRADPGLVRPGASEAVVEGRFVVDGEEVVLTRIVPREGRSRAYVDGRMATAAALAERGEALVELVGQHAHQTLLAPASQRAALDRAASVDLTPLIEARARLRDIDARLDALGGDAGARAREVDLLRHQSREIGAASLGGTDEDATLEAEEDVLADATAHREAGGSALAALASDGGARDLIARGLGALDGRAPFRASAARLAGLLAELDDLVHELRDTSDAVVDDPERLAEVRARRQLILELVRKYGTAGEGDRGSGDLAGVLAYWAEVDDRLATLESHDETAAALEADRRTAEADERRAAAVIGAARRAAAPALAAAVQAHLAELAMGRATVEVVVGETDPGDEVAFLLAANPGGPPAPLAKAASGGELARSMLALRLVLSAEPPVVVFDEVDAGIGGEAALAVGRLLAHLALERQVLVVTHLPQVAAFADAQVSVRKDVDGATTTATAERLADDDRVVELSRMLSGTPGSERVQQAAAELLEVAAAARGR